MLKLITTEVPEGLETYYVKQDDGQFRLNVEDAVSKTEFEAIKSKNNEFRDSNITLQKENKKFKDFSAIFGDGELSIEKIDEKVKKLAEDRVAQVTQDMKAAFETEKTDLNGKLTKNTTRLVELTLGSEIMKAATNHGVVSSAIEDVQARARSAFEVNEEGNVVFKTGVKDASGKDYTVDSWMQKLKSDASHLFVPNQGTDARKNYRGNPIKTSVDNRSAVDKLSAGLNKSNVPIKKLAN